MNDPVSIPVRVLESVPLKRETVTEAGFGALHTPNGNLPLKAVNVYTRITGLYAHTTLEQTFKNTLSTALEATYIFPLPPRAAVTGFKMCVGERVVEAVLEERERARELYEDAILRGHRAGITEEERQNVFTLRVGNLMPGEEARVTFSLVCPLDLDAGEVTYRFPLVVAPRYIPGFPLPDEPVGDGVVPDTDQVPDASRITPPVLLPGFPNPVRLEIQVEIENAGVTISDLSSSLHSVSAIQQDGFIRVDVKPGERLNRDFILRYRLSTQTLSVHAIAAPDANGEPVGTFHCLITAPDVQTDTRPPRDVVFVLDRSGSMSGWKVGAARRVAGRLLDSMESHDRFTVLAFDNVVEAFEPSFVQANNQNRYRAMEWLARIDARRGTEALPALRQAVQILRDSRRNAFRTIVLVTDGQVGNEDAIVREMNQAGIAMFVVGVDMAVNDDLLRRLAEGTGGACELVESQQRVDQVLDKLTVRLGAPVLRDIRIVAQSSGVNISPEDRVPRDGSCLYERGVALLMGRYRALADDWHLLVSGILPDGSPWQQAVRPQVTPHPAIRPAWARALICQLEDKYTARPSRSLEKRILNLSLTHNVLCRFTAYVAIDRSEVVNQGGQLRRIVQPVDFPAGWDHGETYEAFAEEFCLEPEAFASYARCSYDLVKALEVGRYYRLSLPSRHASQDMDNLLDVALEGLRWCSADDPAHARQCLQTIVQALQRWIGELKRKPAATAMVQRLQELLDAIHQFNWSCIDRQALEQLLAQCRETLEALKASGLLKKRRIRWW